MSYVFEELTKGIGYVSETQPTTTDRVSWAKIDTTNNESTLHVAYNGNWVPFDNTNVDINTAVLGILSDVEYVSGTTPTGSHGEHWAEISNNSVAAVHINYNGTWMEYQ